MKKWLVLCFAAASCMTASRTVPSVTVQDLPTESTIRIDNNSDRTLVLSYDYIEWFGSLQMFFIRFRDRDKAILRVSGTADGWFSPKLYHESLSPSPPRKRLEIAARGSVDLARDVEEMASWVRWKGHAEPPCEIQMKLFGYQDGDARRTIVAFTDWQPGPCPRELQGRG